MIKDLRSGISNVLLRKHVDMPMAQRLKRVKIKESVKRNARRSEISKQTQQQLVLISPCLTEPFNCLQQNDEQ